MMLITADHSSILSTAPITEYDSSIGGEWIYGDSYLLTSISKWLGSMHHLNLFHIYSPTIMLVYIFLMRNEGRATLSKNLYDFHIM